MRLPLKSRLSTQSLLSLFLALELRRSSHWASQWASRRGGWAARWASRRGFADLGLRDEASSIWASWWALRRGFADLGFATRRFVGSLGLRGLLGLWFFCYDGVCGFNGFVVFLLWWWVCGFFMVVCGGLTMHCGGGFTINSRFLYFFFFILHRVKHCKIFSEAFSKMQTNTVKTNIFL